jgi:hypothetical protein
MRFDRGVTAATGVGRADGTVQVGDSRLRVPGLTPVDGTLYRLLLVNGSVVGLVGGGGAGTPGPPGPQGPQGDPGPAGPGATASVKYAWAGTDTTVDPGSGRYAISGTGNQPRVIAISEFDHGGTRRNLGLLHLGDSIVVTEDVEPSPTFARYMLTAAPVDQGAYWTATAVRTDTVGGTQSPAVGTVMRLQAYLTDVPPMTLDNLGDVSAPPSTPAGKVLGTTATGAWGPVDPPTSGTDEVWLGPDAPAGATVELWVDTDAVPVGDFPSVEVVDVTGSGATLTTTDALVAFIPAVNGGNGATVSRTARIDYMVAVNVAAGASVVLTLEVRNAGNTTTNASRVFNLYNAGTASKVMSANMFLHYRMEATTGYYIRALARSSVAGGAVYADLTNHRLSKTLLPGALL